MFSVFQIVLLGVVDMAERDQGLCKVRSQEPCFELIAGVER
jgi:hypothetical protein